MLACTLARYAKDDCSVKTTEFLLSNGQWLERSEDEMLCNVLASTDRPGLVTPPSQP